LLFLLTHHTYSKHIFTCIPRIFTSLCLLQVDHVGLLNYQTYPKTLSVVIDKMNSASAINTRAASTASSSLQQSPVNSMPSLPPPAPRPGKTSSTDPFLKDFTLLAEAAKRAQVAVMVRDFEACGLS
jgi:hypothetical protein